MYLLSESPLRIDQRYSTELDDAAIRIFYETHLLKMEGLQMTGASDQRGIFSEVLGARLQLFERLADLEIKRPLALTINSIFNVR